MNVAALVRRRSTWSALASSATRVAFVLVIAYLVLMPLYRLQSLAFSDGASGYRVAFGASRLAETIRTTVTLAFGSLAIALIAGTGLAWAATRLPRRLRWMRVLPVLPIVVPSVAGIIGWTFLLSPGPGYINALLRRLPWWSGLQQGPVDVYSVTWIVIITGIGLTAFVYIFVAAGLGNLNAELIEAAHVSGSSTTGVFFRVVLPLLRPVLVQGGSVALLLGLGQFTGPLLLGRNAGVSVLTTDMYFYLSRSPVNYAAAAAIGSPLLVFGVAVVLAQRVALRHGTRFVTHGGRAFRALGRPSGTATCFVGLYGFVALLLPLIGLSIVALSPYWSDSIRFGDFSFDNFRTIFGQSNITGAISMSLTSSLLAVAIALPVGYVAATMIANRRKGGPTRALVDFLVSVPLGIPAVVIGSGFLLTYARGPFVLYGTRWVVILVYVTLMLPFATRMQLSGLMSLGTTYTEAARVSGAGLIKSNLSVVLPLLRPAIGGAAALIFVLLTHEFAASLLVRAPTTHVMGTILYDNFLDGSYPTVAAMAFVMSAVTATGVVVAMLIGGSSVFDRL